MLSLKRATALAERLKIHLLGCCEMVEVVGAVRRDEEQTAHLELLVLPRLPENDADVRKRLTRLAECLTLLTNDLDTSPFLKLAAPRTDYRMLVVNIPAWQVGDVNCRLYVVEQPEEWSSQLLFHTGPERFVERLVEQAAGRGLELLPHGLFKGDRQIVVENEPALFAVLSLRYVDPAQRR